MANHKSAVKRIRQSEKPPQAQPARPHADAHDGEEDAATRSTPGDATKAAEAFSVAERSIRRAATKGIIPKKRADRSVGRLAKRLNALQAS